MKKIYLLTLQFLIILISLISKCNSSPPVYTFPEKPHKTYNFKVTGSAEFWLKIPANLTTGYNHYISYSNGTKSILELLNVNKNGSSKDYVSESQPGLVGQGGFNIFKFRPKGKGRVSYTLVYKRSWEPDSFYSILLNFYLQ